MLYLTHAENDVWESILASTELVENVPRLSVPNNDQDLIRQWRGSHIQCTTQEYRAALDRFIDAEFIVSIGTHAPKGDGYRLAVDPKQFFVRVIGKRLPFYVSDIVIEHAMTDLRCYSCTPPSSFPSFKQLEELLEYPDPPPAEDDPGYFQGLSHAHLIWLYVGGIPHTNPASVSPSRARGLFYQIGEEDRYLPSHPAFMPVRLYPHTQKPELIAQILRMPETKDDSEHIVVLTPKNNNISILDFGIFNNAGDCEVTFFDEKIVSEISDEELGLRTSICHDLERLLSSGVPVLSASANAREEERQKVAAELARNEERKQRVQALHRQIDEMRSELAMLEMEN